MNCFNSVRTKLVVRKRFIYYLNCEFYLNFLFQILELYELVKNGEKINKLLPQTIERLKALEELHNKGE